jgi:excisionase family DNA binding protein
MAISPNDTLSNASVGSEAAAHFLQLARQALRAMIEEGAAEFVLGRGQASVSMPRREAEAALDNLERTLGKIAAETVSLREAAICLNVPQEYIVNLLRNGTLPYLKEGEEYRPLRAPLEAYQQKTHLEAAKAMGMIAREAWEMGLYE